MSILESPEFIADKIYAKTIEVTEGKIEFHNVYFKYPTSKNNLFEDLSIIIKPKSKIAIVGTNGSGKSTFTNLIMRSYDVNKGAILIDDQIISECLQESIMRNISIVPQNIMLFNRTVAENIGCAKPCATKEEIIAASKKAMCHDIISNLPQQYETLVGENGTNLSGGQKQLIGMARAILKNAPIIILDEATAALDCITAQRLQHSMNNLIENKTAITIAHRIRTLSSVDEILVFDKGRIVEKGTHDDLLKADKLYAMLWETSQGGFIL